jgi:pseudouridine-5'-phosphate glycosidase
MCGPVQDQTLLDLLETVRSLESNGVKVARYQPTTNPTAFTSHAAVMAAVHARSAAALPITVVNGRVVKSGAYASLDEIQDALNAGA